MSKNGLIYRELHPREELLPYIQKFWLIKGCFKDGLNKRVLPSTSGHLFFHFNDLFKRWNASQEIVYENLTSGIAGPNTECFYIEPKGAIHTLGVRFQPFGLQSLLKVPLKLIANRIHDPQNVFLNYRTRWLDGLYRTLVFEEQVEILENFLLKQVGESKGIDKMVVAMIKDSNDVVGQVKSEDLAVKYDLSQRQLENRFKKITGMTHQKFNRLTRFHSILKYFKERPDCSMTELGYEMGYCDQPHFIRDFSALTHISPGKFFKSHKLISDYLTAKI